MSSTPQAPPADGSRLAPEPTPSRIAPPPAEQLERPAKVVREGSPVILARVRTRTLAFVCDTDAGRVHAVDVDAAKEISFVPVGGAGSAVLLPDGRVAVASRLEDAIVILALGTDDTLRIERTWKTGREPSSIALTPDDRTLLVGAAGDDRLEVYDASSGARTLTVPLGQSPSAVASDPTSRHALVASATASTVALVDLGSGAVKKTNLDTDGEKVELLRAEALSGHQWLIAFSSITASTMAQQSHTLVRARHASALGVVNEVAYIAHELVVPDVPPLEVLEDAEPVGYGGAEWMESSEYLGVSILESGTGRRISFHPADNRCRLPRGQVFDASRKQLLVACAGTNNLVALAWSSNVEWYSAESATRTPPSYRTVRSCSLPGPGDGVALDAERSRVLVSTLFGSSLSICSLKGGANAKPPVSVVQLSRGEPLSSSTEASTAAFNRGRALFYRSLDPRIAKDGRACASCHIEGASDKLNWQTDRGVRSTPVLAGRVDRAGPFGWKGQSSDLAAHTKTTIKKQLSGTGLTRSEITDLVAYLRVMPSAQSASRTSELIAHGAEVFSSAAAGCSDCHEEGGRGTDATLHRIGRRTRARFLTPSLIGLGRSGPYFHDGRYRSLEELLAKTDGSMGWTGALSSEDRGALLAYLRSL